MRVTKKGNIIFIEEFLTKEQCADLISLRAKITPGAFFRYENEGNDTRMKSVFDTKIRKANISLLPFEPESLWIYKKLGRAIEKINKKHYQYNLGGFRICDSPSIISYEHYPEDITKGGHYELHSDYYPPVRGANSSQVFSTRKISSSLQLTPSKNYAGADLTFCVAGKTFVAPRKIGTLILFPSLMLHAVTPIRAGKRDALVAWYHGEYNL